MSKRKPRKFKWKPGRCYEDAVRFVMYVENAAIVVHGVAHLITPEGTWVTSGHAWVEMGRGPNRVCIDGLAQSLGGPMPARMYYGFRGAKPVVRYTLKEACSRMSEAGHYGPWQDEA